MNSHRSFIVEEFLREKLRRLEGVFPGERFPIMVTYMIAQPEVAEFALHRESKEFTTRMSLLDMLTGYSTTRAATFKRESRPEDRTHLTIADAEALADGHSFELIDGRMVFKTADRQHSRSQTALTVKLFAHFEQNPIGEVLMANMKILS